MNSVHSLTDCRLVNLIDVTLACEVAYSKLAEHSFEHFFIRPRSDHCQELPSQVPRPTCFQVR